MLNCFSVIWGEFLQFYAFSERAEIIVRITTNLEILWNRIQNVQAFFRVKSDTAKTFLTSEDASAYTSTLWKSSSHSSALRGTS